MGKLNEHVTDFHKKFGQPIGTRPKVPEEKVLRFRAKLHLEEFRELIEAMFGGTYDNRWREIEEVIEKYPLAVNFPEMIDALGDMDYISEGTRIVCGVDGDPIADEIQRANMSKDPAYVEAKDSYHSSATIKPTKPEGWTPPDIEGELKKQGWMP